jgi:hypothetical protein
MDDRVSDFAGADVPDRDRRVGGTVVSAKIIRFVPRRRRADEPPGLSTAAFRSVAAARDHLDTAPCEYVAPQDDF